MDMGDAFQRSPSTENIPVLGKVSQVVNAGPVEATLSTCSTHSTASNEASSDLHQVIHSSLYELIERIVLEQAPEQHSDGFAPLANCLSSYNSRTNRVLTKIICNFEQYVNESYLGVQRRDSAEVGYSGLDAFVAKDMIESCIRQLYPFCQVEAYGSLSTGLWLPGQSDIDLLLDFNKLSISDGSMLKYFPAISPPPFHFYRSSAQRNRNVYSGKVGGAQEPIDVEQQSHMINPVIQNAYLHSWTQLMNRLYLQNGDLQERSYSRQELIVILEEAEEAFRKASWFREIKLIKSAMPVIKFRVCCGEHGIYQIPVDISVLTADHAGLPARDYVCQVINKCPGVFRPLVLALKQLLRENGLHDVYTGGLGSYTLCLLVVFFLIRCGFHLSHLRAKSEYSVKRKAPPAAFHLPPNPLPNQFSTATSEILLDDKGVPPVLDANFEQIYRTHSQQIKQELTTSSEKILKTTGQIRAHIFNTDSVRRIPELLGCLLMGFLRLFCLKEDGGLDLSVVGFKLVDKGKLFLRDKPHSGVLIQCPVTENTTIGFGTYNIIKIQTLFSRLRAELANEPQKLLFFLKHNQTVARKNVYVSTQTPPPMPPPIAPPTLRGNQTPKMASKPDIKKTKKKFTFDVAEMDRQLAAVQEARYKRQLRASNLARFQSETSARKQTLASRYSSIMHLSREKSLPRKPALFNPDKLQRINSKISPVKETIEIKSPEKISSNEKQESEQESKKPSLQNQADFWEQHSLKKSTSVHKKIQPSPANDPKKPTSWATVVKSPISQMNIAETDVTVGFESPSQPTPHTALPPSSPTEIEASFTQFPSNLSYIPNNSAMLKATFATRNRRRFGSKKNLQSRRFKVKEDKLDQRASTVLFVGNLSYHANVADVESLKVEFSSFGHVVDTFYDKQQGMLWIKYTEIKASVMALKHMDQKMFLNRPLYVDFSQMPQDV